MTKTKKGWTPAEDKQLAIYLAQNLKVEKIAQLMNRTMGAVYNRKLKVEPDPNVQSVNLRNHNQVWNDHQDAILRRMAKEGANTKEIADALGRTAASIWCRKSQLKIDTRLAYTPGGALHHYEDPMEFITEETKIPAELVGLFIGRQGVNVKAVSANYDVTISIFEGVATIKGARKDVWSCISAIRKMIEKPQVGEVLEGVVIGTKSFGTFFSLSPIHQGLLHFSKYDETGIPKFGSRHMLIVDSINEEGKLQLEYYTPEPEPVVEEKEVVAEIDLQSEIERMSKELTAKTGKKVSVAAFYIPE
jgi:predicted RNA-binding protein with RPS1 domain